MDRADALMGCTEGPHAEAELASLVDAIDVTAPSVGRTGKCPAKRLLDG
jgi:hypothetical protein